MAKKPFDIEIVMARLREVVKPYPPAAMFGLFDEGYQTVFEQLIACIVSIRTLDEVTVKVVRRLFSTARTVHEMAALKSVEIDRLINESTFHERKAEQILAIAKRAERDYDGSLPCDADLLISFPGVGIKCANLTLAVACGQNRISVDIHVHRITNRWGYVNAPTPEKTMEALAKTLPEVYWIEVNQLLVPFGKYICTGVLPRCSTCAVLDMCQQIGVAKHR